MKTPVFLELCTSLFIFGLPPIMPLMYHQHTFGLKSFNTFGQMLGDRRRRRTGVQVERSAEQGMAAIHPLVYHLETHLAVLQHYRYAFT